MLFSLLLIRAAATDENSELGFKIDILTKEIEELSKSVNELKKLLYVRNDDKETILLGSVKQSPWQDLSSPLIYKQLKNSSLQNFDQNEGRIAAFLPETPKRYFHTRTANKLIPKRPTKKPGVYYRSVAYIKTNASAGVW